MAGSIRGSVKGSWDLGDIEGLHELGVEGREGHYPMAADLGSPAVGAVGGGPGVGRPDSRESDQLLRGAAAKLEGD